MSRPPPILADLGAWDAAASSQRLSAAMAAAPILPADFALDGLSTHSLGGRTHEVATFLHDGARFVLVPGRPAATLGYDRSRPFSPTSAQRNDWKFTQDEYGLKLDEYLDLSMSPLRRPRIAPFLMECVAREFTYGQQGDDQADGYRRVLEA